VAGDDEEMQWFVPIEDLFKGRHFDREIIILCVSWYTSFKLSLRDLVIMMADRGISVTHTTILRWVQRYLPEFEKRWRRYARVVGGSWKRSPCSPVAAARERLPLSHCVCEFPRWLKSPVEYGSFRRSLNSSRPGAQTPFQDCAVGIQS